MNHLNIEITGVNTNFYKSSLSYLELVIQCAEFPFSWEKNQSLGSRFPLTSFFPERYRVCNFPRIKEFLQENMTYTILDCKHFE